MNPEFPILGGKEEMCWEAESSLCFSYIVLVPESHTFLLCGFALMRLYLLSLFPFGNSTYLSQSLSNLVSIIIILIWQKRKLRHRVTYLSNAPMSWRVKGQNLNLGDTNPESVLLGAVLKCFSCVFCELK